MSTRTITTCDRCGRELQKGLHAVINIPRAAAAERVAATSPANAGAANQRDILSGLVSVRPHDICDGCALDYRVMIENYFSEGGTRA